MHISQQSAGEEIANSVSHGVGFLAVIAVTPILVLGAIPHGAASIVGVSIFAATMAVLYLTSTLYHAFPHSPAKRALRVIDHGAIFLLIAGTYTPFTLGILRGAWGWTLFGTVWGLALAGVLFKVVGGRGLRYPIASTAIYLAMGWLVIVAIQPLWQRMPQAGLIWLVAGGVAYTGGVAFYALKRVRYSHFLWHLCVLTGTTCHFFAVIGYAA
ncbi:MAG: hemolysin III family protein [Gemmatimonadetes bacterium]|nr:MAG: hemolysin III family protein [Gemmatimonadota bacterium]